jgi:hypothetical protein
MATANVSYTFVNGATGDGTQVNQNFTDLVNFLNNSVVHKDGSTTMTGALTLPASDPVSENQATRKSYVDSQSVRVFASTAARDAAIPTPAEGQQVYLTDTNRQMFYDGSAWRDAVLQTAMHGVAARRSADFAVSTGTTTALPFTVEDADTDGYHDNATNNTRFTVPAGLGGLYVISSYVRWEPTATTAAVLFPRINGSGTGNTMRAVNQESTVYSSLGLTNLYFLNAGDYVEMMLWHSTGATRSISAITSSSGVDPLSPYFQMWLIGGPKVV